MVGVLAGVGWSFIWQSTVRLRRPPARWRPTLVRGLRVE